MGHYKLEVWGAQGGGSNGGYGGYSVGVVSLNANDVLYITVGGTTSSGTGGSNGGGSITGNVYGGGGATDIRYGGSSLNDILIVAGGGGGSGNGYAGGSGGGAIGNNGAGDNYGYGGTQSSGGGLNDTSCGGSYGVKGIGGSANWYNESIGGGGGGWYGGGSGGGLNNNGSGGGGSGYIGNSFLISYANITKAMYCYYCSSSSATDSLTYSTSNLSSNMVSMYAKSGDGAVRISVIDFFEYTISYNLNGGSVSSNPSVYSFSSSAITLNNPTKSGYSFAGWTGSNGTTPQQAVTISPGSVGDKYYTANWIDNIAPTGTVSLSQISSSLVVATSISDVSGIGSYGYLIQTSNQCPNTGYTSSTNPTYSFSQSLTLNTTYYACVKVFDGAGNNSIFVSSGQIYWSEITYNQISTNYCCGSSCVCTGNNYSLCYTGACSFTNETSSNYNIKFTSTGSLTISNGILYSDIFLVGGGGGGGIGGEATYASFGGGGGGGGYTTTQRGQTLSTGTYTITIGDGGTTGVNGGVTSISTNGSTLMSISGGNGGSNRYGGAGTGAGGVGGYIEGPLDAIASAGVGGSGVYEFNGSSGSIYGGGGGGGNGGAYTISGWVFRETSAAGGSGGGGHGGGAWDGPGLAGTANSGGGGGGGGVLRGAGGTGGTGIVIIRNAR